MDGSIYRLSVIVVNADGFRLLSIDVSIATDDVCQCMFVKADVVCADG